MDLKTKLIIQAGINEDIAIHIVKSLSAAEQKQLCLLDPVQLMQQIPDLMMDANCNDEFELEPIYQKQVPPKPLTDHLLKTGKYPQSTASTNGKTKTDEEDEPSNSLKSYLLCILLGVAIFGLVSSFLPGEKQTITNTETDTKITKSPNASNPAPIVKSEKIPTVTLLPELPPRGSWMFNPGLNYVSKVECKDERFKSFNIDYTIELWLKVTGTINHEINLIELFSNELPIERLFLNDIGQFCFAAGPGFPILKYSKSIPQNGKHYHLAVCKSGDQFKMFINGKLRKDFKIKTSFPKSREGLQLFRTFEATENLAIDEVRVSSEAIYSQEFIPERIFTISAITELYMPLEKTAENSLRFFGINHYKKSEPLTGGKWLNIIYETQVVSNELEKLRKSEKN